ncbi:hypothetical protein AAG906_015549 [Vitis piasezkii]
MAETTKLLIHALGTFPGNLSSKELKCRLQISGRTKDHFASENDVCEISQTHKKGCEITSQQKANLAVTAVGFHLLTSNVFLFASSPCIPDLLMAKDFKALVLHVSELPIALPKIPHNSPQSRIALVIKRILGPFLTNLSTHVDTHHRKFMKHIDACF